MQNDPWAAFPDANPSSPMFTPRPVYRQKPPEPSPQTAPQRRKDELDVVQGEDEAAVLAATREDRIRKARAERVSAERAASRGDPEEAKVRAADQKQRSDLNMIARQLNRVQELYNQDLRGSGIGALGEYLPTPKMQRFESQAKALATLMKPLIKGPNEGTWTDADQALLDRLVPSRFTSDEDNEERIDTAKRLIISKLKKHGGSPRLVPADDPHKKKPDLPSGWSIEEE